MRISLYRALQNTITLTNEETYEESYEEYDEPEIFSDENNTDETTYFEIEDYEESDDEDFDVFEYEGYEEQ